jgi:hypothetical protein
MKFGKIETQYGVIFKDLTELKTANIPYSNTDYPDLLTMKAALDKLLNTPLELTVAPLPSVELGQTIPYIDLAWELNRAPDLQSIGGVGVIGNNLRTYRVNGPFTETETFSITVAKGSDSYSVNVTLAFVNEVYWGASNLQVITPLGISGLNSEPMAARGLSKTLSADAQYLYLAWPARLGRGVIKVNGLLSTAWEEQELVVGNDYDYSEPYLSYRSTYLQNGTGILVEVA